MRLKSVVQLGVIAAGTVSADGGNSVVGKRLRLEIYLRARKGQSVFVHGQSTRRPSDIAAHPNPDPGLLAISCSALHRLDLLYQYDYLDMLADVSVEENLYSTR